MKNRATFYHAGCPVCLAAECNVAHALDPSRYDVEVVHLGTDKTRIAEAELAGDGDWAWNWHDPTRARAPRIERLAPRNNGELGRS